TVVTTNTMGIHLEINTESEADKPLADDGQWLVEIRTDGAGHTSHGIFVENVVEVHRGLHTISLQRSSHITKAQVQSVNVGQTVISSPFQRHGNTGLVESHGLAAGVHTTLEKLSRLQWIARVVLIVSAHGNSPGRIVGAAQLSHELAVVTQEVARV